MFDYQQRTTTPEYRDGWDIIWGKKDSDFGKSRLVRDVMDEVICEILDNPKPIRGSDDLERKTT